MKSLKLLIFFLVFICLFNYAKLTCGISYYSDDEEDPGATSVSACINREFNDEEKEEGAYKCCFMEAEAEILGKTQTSRACVPVTKSQYDDIDDLIDTLEDLEEDIDLDIEDFDCQSNYIKSVLLLLFIFLC